MQNVQMSRSFHSQLQDEVQETRCRGGSASAKLFAWSLNRLDTWLTCSYGRVQNLSPNGQEKLISNT